MENINLQKKRPTYDQENYSALREMVSESAKDPGRGGSDDINDIDSAGKSNTEHRVPMHRRGTVGSTQKDLL